jgi:hypothetical protein
MRAISSHDGSRQLLCTGKEMLPASMQSVLMNTAVTQDGRVGFLDRQPLHGFQVTRDLCPAVLERLDASGIVTTPRSRQFTSPVMCSVQHC